MSVYLHDIPLPEAWAVFEEALDSAGRWGVLECEEIALDEKALGRVLADSIWAKLSSPHYHASAMDGFAVRSDHTVGAVPSRPLELKVGTQTQYVDTGDPLPDWANAVIPIELVEGLDERGNLVKDSHNPPIIRIRSAINPWRHVRAMGEDIVATQLVLPAGHVIRPVDLGAIAASGHVKIHVARQPKVAILPTGTELVPVGTAVKIGDIIEFNSIVLAAQVRLWGGISKRYPIIPDDKKLISAAVQRASNENDLVLLSAGSSAGSEDFSAKIVSELGDLLVHGIAIRPGHPVILGMIDCSEGSHKPGSKVPIIGVPGYPVSSALTGELFVQTLISRWLGRKLEEPVELSAKLTRKVTSPPGDDDYMRVVVGKVDGQFMATPISRGAGVISSLVQADGITILPRRVQGLEAGADVKVRLYRSKTELEGTIFVIGSHDMTLDLVAQYLSQKDRRLVSANVGSLGGLVSLSRGEAHIAGAHLLDPETGEYNISYVRKYLPDMAVKLVTWAGREQGFIVEKGNPFHILTFQDLIRSDIRYVNRQRGAGTRVLFDFHLDRLAISRKDIPGYELEEYTHLSVAAAIASGRANCGLGIAAAARALELDFIPLFIERFDLVIPCKYFEDDLLDPLFDLMRNKKFRDAVADLPGYDISKMGEIILECT